ncbi:uncharacterized protein B0H64DRAFT_476429 [Chaetomium fimeti]|uniref:Uncharacterized protein n=1 Tax=Chaetomium fimeti TaxID=1854472 RepID=A0AAE0HEG9_9PEZI|nr:hypothetical protein B0H64DRAFT_476429 [Chaetomium fimeti]
MDFLKRWNEHRRLRDTRRKIWCQVCDHKIAASNTPQDGTTDMAFANFEEHYSNVHFGLLAEKGGEDQKREFIQVQWEAAKTHKSPTPCIKREASKSRSMSPPKRSMPRPATPPVEEADATETIKQLETMPISEEQLVAEVKGIYAGLVLVESKCIEVDNIQSSQTSSANKLEPDQRQALITLHGSLIYPHYDPSFVSQDPSASPALRKLAAKYSMPTRINNAMASTSRKAVPSALPASQKNQSFGRPSSHSTEIRDRRVCGVINGTQIRAIPDTGADESFISASFLKRLKRRQPAGPGMGIQEVEARDGPTVRLASGKTVTCTSTASIPWTFEGENRTYRLDCRVLPKCPQDLILGDGFLRLTETLTSFKHRISTTLRSLATKKLFRLNYMGHDKRRLWGHLDGDPVAALPDSGSDIMAISADYARRRGFQIDRGYDNRVMVQFADGSTAWTDGVVRDLQWEFGLTDDSKVACDFYVLENLPVDVLFNSDFVFDYNVFGQHDNSLFSYGGLLDVLDLCNIRLVGRYYRKHTKPQEEGLIDVTSPNAFSPLMVQRELARRDAIRDIMAGLPVAERASAQQAEVERQRQWEQWRAEHAQRWASTAGLGSRPLRPEPAMTAQTSQQVAAASSGRTGVLVRAGRWAWKNCKVASIPLMPLRKRVAESVVVVV